MQPSSDLRRRKRRARRAPAAYSFLALDRGSAEPLYLQLTNRIRDAIVAGLLSPGSRLPSTREIAADLEVSRNTAANAFEALFAEGYIEGRPGSGTYVAEVLPDDCIAAPGAAVEPEAGGAAAREAPARPALSRRAARILAAAEALTAPASAVAFRMSTPALDAFPVDVWSRLEARGRALPRRVLLGYGEAAGYGPLREAIAAYLRVARGVRCDASRVVVVAGAQQGIGLVARVVLDPGDEAWLEEPGYPGARIALEAAGARVVAVPVDAEGLSVAAGLASAPGARLAYVTPSHQFPLGVAMSGARRAALLEWARRSGAWVLEDDYDSEYRYATRPIPALQGADAHDRVVFLGTFSKVLFPSLRLGYLVLPPDLVAPVLAARLGEAPPTHQQVVLADFVNEGHLFAHVRRMRALYAERQAALLDEARARLGGLVEVEPSDAGMFLVARLPEDVDDVEVSRAAAALGVDAQALSPFYAGPGAGNGLLLGYACAGRREARRGAELLARAIESVRRR